MSNANANNDFLLNIKSRYPSLTRAEKKVADFVLKNPREVRFMSIMDLSSACNVGLTSVFRLCKVLNLQGYQEFKVQLSLSLSNDEADENEVLPADVTTKDSVGRAVQKLLQSHINALTESATMMNPENLTQAAKFIMQSDQVRFFGVGGSMLTAMEGMYKFLHIMPNVYCLSDIHMQVMSSSTMNKQDVAIFISHSGESREIVQMAKKAHESGARSICITHYSKSPLTEYADVVLLCGGYEPPLQDGSFSIKIAQIFVLDLLFTEVYRHKFKYSKEINEIATISILDKNY